MNIFTKNGLIHYTWTLLAQMLVGKKPMMIFSKWGGRSKQQGSLAYPEHTFRARAELAEVLWWVRRRGAEPGSFQGVRRPEVHEGWLTCRKGRMRGAEMDEIS